MSEQLPPAVLDLIVNFQEWVAGLEESIASLEGLDASITETAAMVDEFGASVTAATAEAAAAMEEASAAMTASADETAAALDQLGAAADAAAAAQDRAAAATKGTSERTAASGGVLAGAADAIGSVAVKATEAAAGIGVASLAMAGDFQAAVTRLVTSAGESSGAVGLVSKGLLDMSQQVGFGAVEMAKAMYPVEGAGYHAADGLLVMKAAAEGAKDEGADLSHVTDAVTTVMQDYNLKATDAADITSKMVTAISFGKTNFDAFSKSLSTVLPIASAVHLSFADVATVEAAMTAHGTTAQRAAMDVAAAIKSLISPTTQMTKEFKALGISSDEVQQHLSKDGLAGTLEWLRQTAEKGATAIGQTVPEAMKKLIGTSPGLQAALEATNGSADTLSQAIQKVGSATADAQGNVVGFSEVQNNLSFITDKVKASLEATAISIGNALMPAAEGLLRLLSQMFDSLGKNADFTDALNVMIKALGDSLTALQPVFAPLMAAFKDLMVVVGALLVDAIKALAPATAVILQAFDDLLKALEPLLPVISDIADVLGKLAGDALKALLQAIEPLLPPLTDLVKVVLTTLLQVLKDLAPSVTNLIKAVVGVIPAFAPLIPVITDLVKNIVPFVDVTAKLAGILIDGLAKALDLAAKGFTEFMRTGSQIGLWIDDLPKKFEGMSEDIGRWINDLPRQVGDAFRELGAVIGATWDQAMGSLRQKAQDSVTATVETFTNLPQKLGYAIGQAAGTVLRESATIGKNLEQGVRGSAEAVVRFFDVDLPKAIQNAVADAGSWLKTTGVQIVRGLVDALVARATDVERWFLNLPNQIRAWVSDAYSWLVQTGRNLIQGLVDSVLGKLGDIGRAMTGGGNSVKNAVVSPFTNAGVWLVTSGADIVHGLWSGITGGWSWLMGQISSFANSIKDGFNAALGINSPSRVMADTVGVGIVEGIAKGMVDNLHLIHGAVGSVQGALTGFNGAGTGASFGVGLPPGVGGFAGAGSGGAGGILIINNNVQGSVVAEQQLAQLNQTQALRYNFRNPTNGLALFGRGRSA